MNRNGHLRAEERRGRSELAGQRGEVANRPYRFRRNPGEAGHCPGRSPGGLAPKSAMTGIFGRTAKPAALEFELVRIIHRGRSSPGLQFAASAVDLGETVPSLGVHL